MPEILGEGFVQILPVTGPAFDAALSKQMLASLAAIEKQFATSAGGLSAAAANARPEFSALNQLFAKSDAVLRSQLNPALKATEDVTKKATAAVNNASASFTGLQRSFTGLTRLVPILAGAFSVKLFGDFEKAAKEASVVFGDSANEVIGFAEKQSEALRLTSTVALRFAVDFGNALQGIGFSSKTAAAASEELTKRTADTAAALAKTPQQIATAFNLALEGNARGLKQLGITISATDQQNRAAQLGFKGTISELTDAQRAAVFYSLVLERTAKFQGQAAATADTFAGRLGALKTSAGDAAIAIGASLAPAVEAIFAALKPVLDLVGEIPAPFLAFATTAGTVAIALNFLSGSAIGKFVTSMFSAQAAVVETTVATEGLVIGLEEVDAALVETAAVADTAFPLMGAFALAAGAAAAIFTIFRGKSDDASAALKNLGDAAGDTAKQFKILTTVDIGKFASDLKDLADIGAVELGGKILTGDVEQLQGLDLDNILKRAKAVKDAFASLLTMKGTAGIGATKDALDALNAAGLGNTDTVKELQAAFDKEVAARLAANKATDDGANILNADNAVREQNAAQVKAQTDAINDLFTVTESLGKARRTEQEAVADQATAQQKLNALVKEGGKQEIIDARIKLGDATDSLTAALLRQAEAQKALDKLNAPATERELSDATDALTLAQIAEAQATRARDAALAALNKTQTRAIDLTHLSLDQLRTTLANARATLAAQRTTAPSTGATLQETAVTAEIDLRAAKEKTADAAKDLLDLQQKGLVKTDEILHQEREVVLAKNATQKAQEQVNKTQGELDAKLAGNTEWAKQLASAQMSVREATDKVHDAQQSITDLVAKQKEDTDTILGTNHLINDELVRQIGLHKDLFAQDAALRRGLVENTLAAANVTLNLGGGKFGPTFPGALGQSTIDQLFTALAGQNQQQFIDLLKRIGLIVPGHAEGALVTRPELAWIGEKFRPESVIPWTRPDRVWAELAKAVPHMPTAIRQRLEPVIPGRPTVSAASHLNVPVAEIDYTALGKVVAKALKEADVGGGDIHVHPTPGMDEARLARKVAREANRYRGMP